MIDGASPEAHGSAFAVRGDAARAALPEDLFSGPLARVPAPLIGPEAPPAAMAAERLREPARLRSLLERFGGAGVGHDLRGLASQWSKWYCNALLGPALAVDVLLRRQLPLGPGCVHVCLDDDARPQRLCLTHAGDRTWQTDPAERFAFVLDHLAPLIEALATTSGAAPRVFWGNAGNAFEHALGLLERHPWASPDAASAGRTLLAQRYLAGGRRNPLHRPIEYCVAPCGTARRTRRVCCIRYLLPGVGYCGSCPLA